jgi:lipase
LLYRERRCFPIRTPTRRRLQGQHKIIAPDLIGFGRTGAWPRSGELTHDLQAELVAALIGEEGGGAVDVVGHSYGGAVAVRLALRRPELVRTLVLVEPVLTLLLREAGDPLFGEYRDDRPPPSGPQ